MLNISTTLVFLHQALFEENTYVGLADWFDIRKQALIYQTIFLSPKRNPVISCFSESKFAKRSLDVATILSLFSSQ